MNIIYSKIIALYLVIMSHTLYSYKKLRTLPGLPEQLHKLDCSYNQLNKIYKLPGQLHTLICHSNHLTQLPKLPEHLRELDCHRNNIKQLPKLPKHLRILACHNNPLLYLPISLRVSNCNVIMDLKDRNILYKKGVGYMITKQHRKRRLKKWFLQWISHPYMNHFFGNDIVAIINRYL